MKNYLFISVVIPTFNRYKILRKAIKIFLRQNYPKDKYELVVIGDGSSDKTGKMVKGFKEITPEIKYLFQRNKGPAAARNLGINKCKGKIVLFTNDDIIPEKDLVYQHVRLHLKYPEENFAVLGFVTWSQDLKITPFMKWLEKGGPQFSYHEIRGIWANWWQAWTCNLSFKKSFLLKYGLFDSDFIYPAWEDIELAYRLSKRKLKLIYNQKAVGYHYHPTSIHSTLSKMKKHGASTVILGQKIADKQVLPPLARPKMGKLIDFLDRIFFLAPIRFLIEKIAFWAEKRLNLGFIYNLLLLHYRVVGRREFLKRKC